MWIEKSLRFMGEGAAYNYIAMKEAIEHSGLDETSQYQIVNTGISNGVWWPINIINYNKLLI